MRLILVTTILFGLAGSSRADDLCPPEACGDPPRCCAKEKCRGEFSLDRLIGWATYRAHRAPRGEFYFPGPMPPLYTFFLHCWREPSIVLPPSHCGSCKGCR